LSKASHKKAVKRLGDPNVFKQIILEDIALGKP
jgi:hypothetical protein